MKKYRTNYGWHSLQFKASIFLVLLLLCTVVLISVLTLKAIEDNQQLQVEEYLSSIVRSANLYLKQNYLRLDAPQDPSLFLSQQSAPLIENIFNDRWLSVEIFDSKGDPLKSTQFDKTRSHTQEHKKALTLALNNQIAYAQTLTSTDFYAPLYINDNQIGAIRLNYFNQSNQQFYSSIKQMLYTVGSSVFAVSLIAALLYFGQITQVVNRLEHSVHAVERGDYTSINTIHRKDQLGTLSLGICHMAKTIEENISNLEDEHAKLSLAISKLKSMEEKQRSFFGAITHEFKTPLSVINACNDVSEMYNDDPELSITTRVQIRTEVARLNQMVEQALQLAQLEKYDFELTLEPLALEALIEEAIHRLEIKAAKYKISFRTLLEPCTANGDYDSMMQILINLLDNAIKYNRIGGQVDLTLKPTNDHVILSIKDTGKGLPQQLNHPIFDPFNSNNNQNITDVKGTGLGLTLVKQLVAMHHGEITLSNHPDGGCIATLTLNRVILS